MAINDEYLGFFFPIALLSGGNFIVKNDYVAIQFPHLIDNLFELTLSQYVTWKSLADADNGFPANLDPKVAYQFAQFLQKGFGFFPFVLSPDDRYEKGPFD